MAGSLCRWLWLHETVPVTAAERLILFFYSFFLFMLTLQKKKNYCSYDFERYACTAFVSPAILVNTSMHRFFFFIAAVRCILRSSRLRERELMMIAGL